MTQKTVFKRIIDGELPADVIYEDDQCLAFRDIQAQAPTHVLLIPKVEIVNLDAIRDQHAALLGHMWTVIPRLARELELQSGYRVVVNCGTDGGQSVDHLHFHILGGRALRWPPG